MEKINKRSPINKNIIELIWPQVSIIGVYSVFAWKKRNMFHRLVSPLKSKITFKIDCFHIDFFPATGVNTSGIKTLERVYSADVIRPRKLLFPAIKNRLFFSVFCIISIGKNRGKMYFLDCPEIR